MNRPSLEGVILREGLSYNDLGLMGRSEIESKLSSFLTFKGTVNAIADLPTDATQGDVYFVGELQRNYAFNGLVWNDMGGSVDMSIYQKRQGDTLTTTNKSIEGGINELDGRIGKTAMTTAATNVTAAINELDNDKLDVEPGGLNTTATKVVDAINEINSLLDMYEIVVAGGSGSLDDVDYTKISQHPAHCYIRRGGEIYQYAYTNSGQFMYHVNRPDLTKVIEAWIVIGSDQSWTLYTLWDDNSKLTRPDTKYVTINTEQTLNDYINQMPNNSIKDGYSTPWGMTEPGWTTIHKYNNNFVKIIHWTRREGLAYVRSRDNSTTWSDWYKINMAKTTEQKAGMMGNFLEIKNSSYEFHTYGGTIQLNDQRNSMGFMCGNNMNISVINNPDNIPFTRPAAPTGWTYCVQFTSANGTCKVLWDNSGHRMGYTEENCSFFGRHIIVCAEKT